MTASHDGDRVSRETTRGTRRRLHRDAADRQFADGLAKQSRGGDLLDLSGSYGCSVPGIDHIVDLAQRLPGVEGAQLAGAGLGGCVMVLVQRPHTASLQKALMDRGIPAEIFRPIAGACSLAIS
jgi:N-acetylgalactosamine kinase